MLVGAEIEDQKASRVTIAKKHLGHLNLDGNKFLNCIVTLDEMWVCYAEPETKAQSKQLKPAGSPPPKKFKLSPSTGCFLGFTWNNTHSFYAKR